MSYDYSRFLKSEAAAQWRRIGIRRRSGMAVPLFSLRSRKSAGIGEITDLKLMVDFCKKCGMSLLQLLPLNDVGWKFCPYDSDSAFALEPMHLSIENLRGAKLTSAEKLRVKKIRRKFPFRPKQGVNYGVKKVKMAVLWDIWRRTDTPRSSSAYKAFLKSSRWWLQDYALFKTLKEQFKDKAWFLWPASVRNRNQKSLGHLKAENKERYEFYVWLQWQLFEQMREAKRYAASRGVLLMGDIPFLVSRDSSEVWAHQEYFKLNYSSGAPPDFYSKKGQRWGMPPYNWERMSRKAYDYWTQRLKYAENFYDLYRVDHAIGLFRIWSIPDRAPRNKQGIPGHYVPMRKAEWERQGRKLLSSFINTTRMLPCAEDLGTVPECSYRVLKEFAIPGTDIQRWLIRSGTSYLPPDQYRSNSVAMLSTHDMDTLVGWWAKEMKKLSEKTRYWRFVGGSGRAPRTFNKELTRKAIFTLSSSASIFCVLMLQDCLALERNFRPNPRRDRINVPSSTSSQNWSYLCPYTLEELKALSICDSIRKINYDSGRRM